MLGHEILECNGRPHRARAEKVVTAGVPRLPVLAQHPFRAGRLGDAREGIEFCEDAEHRAPLAIFRHEGGGHAGHPWRHAKASVLERVLQ